MKKEQLAEENGASSKAERRAAARLLPLIGQRLWPSPEGPSPGSVWIQGVSVGEVELAATLGLALRSHLPGIPLLVTSTTPAGVAHLARRFPREDGLTTYPFPLDLPFSVGRFLAAARPRLLILLETEIWPVLLLRAGALGMPVLVVNGRLSRRSAGRLSLARPLLRRALSAISAVAARSAADAARFTAIGIPEARISVAGDLKFDRSPPPEPAFAGALRQLAGGRPVLVAGSIADEELDLVLDVRNRLASSGTDLLLLLAPRQPSVFDSAARKLRDSGLSVARRSTPPGTGGAGASSARPDVFLLDTIGELAGAYRLGDLAILGGTFARRGGHNVLEPLAAGVPTLVGPSVWNIRETVEEAAGAVFGVDGAAGAADAAARLLGDEPARRAAANVARELFGRNAGAADRAARLAAGFLERTGR